MIDTRKALRPMRRKGFLSKPFKTLDEYLITSREDKYVDMAILTKQYKNGCYKILERKVSNVVFDDDGNHEIKDLKITFNLNITVQEGCLNCVSMELNEDEAIDFIIANDLTPKTTTRIIYQTKITQTTWV